MSTFATIQSLLGSEADSLLNHKAKVSRDAIHVPSPSYVDSAFGPSDRSPQVLRSLQAMFGHGRLANTGYLSILPVDQGSENIVKLAIDGGCNAVATTFGVLASVSRRYAHRIPMMVKINHNELMTYPNKFDQIMFGSVREAWNLGACAVGATIYFGSDNSTRQIVEVARAFEEAHSLGMATVLWCYIRNNAFKAGGKDYHTSADLTGQANHLGVTIKADIIKQKLPELNGGFTALNSGDSSYGKLDKRMYTDLASDHPIDLCRYQVLNCYCGRAGLINSGGASGANDLAEAVKTAVINKRAGGMGLISGRKAFQKPMAEGVSLLHAIQDVYLCGDVTVA
jgi:class I fructose-bisphosphate aldolase